MSCKSESFNALKTHEKTRRCQENSKFCDKSVREWRKQCVVSDMQHFLLKLFWYKMEFYFEIFCVGKGLKCFRIQ